MKKFAFSLTALAIALLIPLTTLAQPTGNEIGQTQAKTQILIAVNRAELSLEQLQTLQGIVQGTIDAQTTVGQAQDALQEFLINWTGTEADFEVALEAEQQKVQEAFAALRALKVQNSETIKDSLTASQFDALERALGGVMGSEQDNAPAGRGGPSGDNAPNNDNQRPNGNNRGPDGGPNGSDRGRDDQRRAGGPGGNLELLLEALTEKIAAIG